jgi:hypothetical protein
VQKVYVALVALASAALAGCGGGGGSGTSISVDQASVTFTAASAGTLPAGRQIRATFKGDGILIGYPADVPEPSWLGLQLLSQTGSSATLAVSILQTDLPPGSYSTTLRFVTGRADGSGLKHVDVPVSYSVTGSALEASIEPASGAGLAAEGGPVPASLTFTVEHTGDSLQVPAVPAWMQLTETASTPGSKSYRVDFTTTALPPQYYGTALMFRSVRPNGDRTVYYQVGYTVVAALSLSPAASSFTHIRGADAEPAPAAARSVTISSAARDWTASSDQGWLVLAQAAGTGPTVGFTIDYDALELGANVAQVTVENAPTRETRTVALTVNARAPRLVISPTATGISVDGLTTAAQSLAQLEITDEIGGSDEAVSWSVQSIDADWLSATPASGTTLPAATVDLKVVAAELADVENGEHAATVTLGYTNADSSGSVEVPLTLTLRMPKVHYVAPYTAEAATPGTVVVRGENFDTAPVDLVTLDDAPATVSYVSPTELRLTHDGLAAGAHPVAAGNMLGTASQSADLVAIDSPAYAYSAIDSTHYKRRVMADFERGFLYVVDGEDLDLERYRQVDGAWVGARLTTPANVNDIALSPDGKTLVLLTDTSLYEADAGADPLTWVEKVKAGVGNSAQFRYGTLAMLNDGRVLISSQDQWAWLYAYDVRNHVLIGKAIPDFVWGVKLFGSRGGTVAMMNHQNCCNYLFNASDGAYGRATGFIGHHVAFSPLGEKFVVGSDQVFNADASLMLGKVQGSGSGGTIGDGGERAYTYSFGYDPTVSEIREYDLTASTDLNGYFPLLRTIPLPLNISSGSYYDASTLLSLDQGTVFVFGTGKFVVMPLP